MGNIIKSELLILKPASLRDKAKIFDWLTASDLTAEMLGPPKFPENPIPSWEEFDKDYADYYFDGSEPMKGRCFIVQYENEEIGQINYNGIDIVNKLTDIDIWLAKKQFTGRGLGTEAIIKFCDYLYKSLNCKTVYVAPSKRNTNAIKAYVKAGFKETDYIETSVVKDYYDTVILVRKAE